MKREGVIARGALSLMVMTMMAGTAEGVVKVHTLGDSTMAPYDESATVTRGWGMYVQQFLSDAKAINYARGGRDARGGLEELWPTAKKAVEEGDYVIISFGHNDEKNSGMDGVELYNYYVSTGQTEKANSVDKRGTIPTTTYKKCLGAIVDEVRAMKATPVLVSPVCRSYFSGSTIKRNGRHDLGDNFSVLTSEGVKEGQKVGTDDHRMDYAYHCKQLADSVGVPFIDLTTATKELYESYGDTKSHEVLFDGDGSTHFSSTGAAIVARIWAQEMQKLGLLGEHIRLTSELSVMPTEAAFGSAYAGQKMTKELMINGFDLKPENGEITVTATEGIEVSADKENWSSEVKVAYSGGTVVENVYIQVTLPAEGGVEGTVSIRQGETSIEVPVTASTVALGEGEVVEVRWRLESAAKYSLSGPAEPIEEKYEGMTLQSYNSPKGGATLWADVEGGNDETHPNTYKMQRNVIDSEGGTWPKDEIDDNPTRYIEFAVKAVEGTTLQISDIGLRIAGAGGNGMMCHVYYSVDEYETRTTMFAPSKMTSNTIYEIEAKPVVKISGEQVVRLRVYPWYNGGATGKTICLSDVVVKGVAVANVEEPTGMEETRVTGGEDVASEEIYSIDGRRGGKTRGLVVSVKKYADGRVKVEKRLNNL